MTILNWNFIYCIYDRGDGQYVFGLDPSDDPGTFNDPVVTTPALEEDSQASISLADPDFRGPFIDAITRRRESGSWESIEETLPSRETVHAFIRRISVNPVTGKAAIALIVLAVR